MKIVQSDNLWAIHHAGKTIAKRFLTEAEAERWADHNIDDQVFDGPNWFSDPLPYEDTPDARRTPLADRTARRTGRARPTKGTDDAK